MATQGAETALFLQHVRELEIWHWRHGAPAPTRAWGLNVSDATARADGPGPCPPLDSASSAATSAAASSAATAALAAKRTALHGWARAELDAWDASRVTGRERGGWRDVGAAVALAQRMRAAGPDRPPRATLRLRVEIVGGRRGHRRRRSSSSSSSDGHGSAGDGGGGGGVAWGGGDEVELVVEEWFLRSGVGTGSSWALATSSEAESAEHALWPAVTVAARAWRAIATRGSSGGSSGSGSGSGSGGSSALPAVAAQQRWEFDRRVAVTGSAFAALKITTLPTGWPVHVSARWALSDNRRELVRGSAASEKLEASWNACLLADAVPRLWAELLVCLRAAPNLGAAGYYSLWPAFAVREEDDRAASGGGAPAGSSAALFASAVGPALALLAALPVFRTLPPCAGPGDAAPLRIAYLTGHGGGEGSGGTSVAVRASVHVEPNSGKPRGNGGGGGGGFLKRGLSLLGGGQRGAAAGSLLPGHGGGLGGGDGGVGPSGASLEGWAHLHDVAFVLGVGCPDLPPLAPGGEGVGGESGGGGGAVVAAGGGGGLVGPAAAVLGRSGGVGGAPLCQLAPGSGEGTGARVAWLLLVLAYECGALATELLKRGPANGVGAVRAVNLASHHRLRPIGEREKEGERERERERGRVCVFVTWVRSRWSVDPFSAARGILSELCARVPLQSLNVSSAPLFPRVPCPQRCSAARRGASPDGSATAVAACSRSSPAPRSAAASRSPPPRCSRRSPRRGAALEPGRSPTAAAPA